MSLDLYVVLSPGALWQGTRMSQRAIAGEDALTRRPAGRFHQPYFARAFWRVIPNIPSKNILSTGSATAARDVHVP